MGCFSQLPKKSIYIWATLVKKYATKNFKKSSNLVTLISVPKVRLFITFHRTAATCVEFTLFDYSCTHMHDLFNDSNLILFINPRLNIISSLCSAQAETSSSASAARHWQDRWRHGRTEWRISVPGLTTWPEMTSHIFKMIFLKKSTCSASFSFNITTRTWL